MTSGFLSALLVLAGGLCAISGYLLGERHERRAVRVAFVRFRQTVDGRTEDEAFEDPSPDRDQRPN